MISTVSSAAAAVTQMPKPGTNLSAEDAATFLGTRSLNDLMRAGQKISWDQLPKAIKYSDVGDVPSDTTVTYVKLPALQGEALYAGIVDYPSYRMSEVIIATLESPILAHGEVKGSGRWNKTIKVD